MRIIQFSLFFFILNASGFATAEPFTRRPILRIDAIDTAKAPEIAVDITDLDGAQQAIIDRKAKLYRLFIDRVPHQGAISRQNISKLNEAFALSFVIQVSPAMTSVHTEVVEAAKKILRALPSRSKVGLVAYTDVVVKEVKPTTIKKLDRALDDLRIRTDGIEVQLLDAVKDAIEGLDSQNLPKRKMIVVISDGLNANLETRAFSDLGRRARDKNIAIHSIGFAQIEAERLRRTLVELSRRSNGTFRFGKDAKSLSAACEDLKDEILNGIRLIFSIEKSCDGSLHELQLELASGQTSNPVGIELPKIAVKANQEGDSSDKEGLGIGFFIIVALVLVAFTAGGYFLLTILRSRTPLPPMQTRSYDDEDEEDEEDEEDVEDEEDEDKEKLSESSDPQRSMRARMGENIQRTIDGLFEQNKYSHPADPTGASTVKQVGTQGHSYYGADDESPDPTEMIDLNKEQSNWSNAANAHVVSRSNPGKNVSAPSPARSTPSNHLDSTKPKPPVAAEHAIHRPNGNKALSSSTMPMVISSDLKERIGKNAEKFGGVQSGKIDNSTPLAATPAAKASTPHKKKDDQHKDESNAIPMDKSAILDLPDPDAFVRLQQKEDTEQVDDTQPELKSADVSRIDIPAPRDFLAAQQENKVSNTSIKSDVKDFECSPPTIPDMSIPTAEALNTASNSENSISSEALRSSASSSPERSPLASKTQDNQPPLGQAVGKPFLDNDATELMQMRPMEDGEQIGSMLDQKTMVIAQEDLGGSDFQAWISPINDITLSTHVLSDSFLIGSSSNANVHIEGVAEESARFRLDSRGYVLEVYENEDRHFSRPLNDNDVFQIGNKSFVYKMAARFPNRIIAEARIEVLNGFDQGRQLGLPNGEVLTIGSASNCDLVIRGKGIAPRHLALFRNARQCVISDLGSEHGLVVGEEVLAHCTLNPGDRVSIGDIWLVYALEDREIYQGDPKAVSC